MTQEEISKVILEENFQKIIQEKDFYFLKGQIALQRWLDVQFSDQLKEDIIRLSSDYKQFQETAEVDPEIEKIMDLLLEIVSYLDSHAKDKFKYNQYDDKRTVARASVRMGNWIDGLVKLKFKHAEITGPSITNAFNFILSPKENSPLLSETMREQVTKNLFKKSYHTENFVSDLEEYFRKFDLRVANADNYTFLISNLLYQFYSEWGEQVIGLMSSDGTGWHEDELALDPKFSGLITWNSKKPSGGAETLKFLRAIINEGETFPLYVSSKYQVSYRIEVKDFVTSQKELDDSGWDKENIKYYSKNFSDFKDKNKSAYIVFLAESISKIEPKSIDDFIFYKSYVKPTQDNLSPIKQIIGEETDVIPSTPSNSSGGSLPPLNQIFFGPPGTGKTYHTINEALRIVGIDIKGMTRKEIKTEFDKKLASGEIVFTTFHQSMSYEDFIEGIKPNLDDGDIDEENDTEIEYVVKPGIFKRISERARNSISSKYSFDDLWTEYYNDLISKGAVEFTSVSSELKLEPSESKMERLGVRFKKSYDPDAAEGKKVFPVSKNIIKKLFDNQIDATETHARQEIRTIVGGGRATTYYAVYKSFYDFVSSKGKLNSKKQNYVLIIDEINRGNVSQIFGELITLIEKDKRLGKEEELKVTLPYSNDKFGVPSNLYIIGTMNTADRSVEALDTALRRRFSFREMPPIYNLEGLNFEYEGIKGSDILKTINRRIEKLLDRDHLIGHSFFLLGKNEDPETKLIQSFYQNLIPLLQEYFYGDYAKIGAVLGSGFVTKQEDFSQIEFAKGFIDEDDSDKDIFQIIDYRPDHPGNNYAQPGMTFQKALLRLMNIPTE